MTFSARGLLSRPHQLGRGLRKAGPLVAALLLLPGPSHAQDAALPLPVALDARPRVDQADFEVSLETPGEARLGTPMEVEVHLVAKNGKKVNFDYPTKLIIEANPTWETVSMRKLEKVGGDEAHAVLTATVRARSAGAQSLSVRIHFSVCTKTQCLVEKHLLTDTVTVR